VAERRARALALEHAGALAFSRTGDPAAASFPGRRLLIKSGFRFCVRFQRMRGYLAKSANIMRSAANKPAPPALGIFSPLRYAVFRRTGPQACCPTSGFSFWGSAPPYRSMTKISSSTGMVALVQTSLMLPVALVSTPAWRDRRYA
jgi:hypothetical protein